jgi:hypothetical protein
VTRPQCLVCARPTDVFLCTDCSSDLRDVFADLPDLAEAVADLASRQSRVYRASRRVRTPDQDWRGSEYALRPNPWPVDLDAAALLAELGDTPARCADRIAHTHRLIAPLGAAPIIEDVPIVTVVRNRWRITREVRIVRHREPRTVAGLVRWLLGHVNEIRYDETADQIHHDMHHLRDRMRRAVDRAPSAFYAGPCHATVTEPVVEERGGTIYSHVITHRCERDLYAWPGREGEIRCDGYRSRTPGDQGCGAVHSVGEREQFLLDSIEDALVPLDVLRDVTKGKRPLLRLTWPPNATVRSWRFRGQLPVRYLDQQGRELFRGGDVLDLLTEWNEREQSTSGRMRA